MAKLSLETTQTIWDLQHQLLEIIDTARTLELSLFEAFGETELTAAYLDELTFQIQLETLTVLNKYHSL
jgi:hypothetical protein